LRLFSASPAHDKSATASGILVGPEMIEIQYRVNIFCFCDKLSLRVETPALRSAPKRIAPVTAVELLPPVGFPRPVARDQNLPAARATA
jgi:hypothetical protein